MISAIVLSRNDEGRIAKTLASLTWCDELIVIDDYSTDKTTDIAAKFHAKIYRRRLEGDFAAQRNFGLSRAAGDWLLFIDSDEIVSPPLAGEIKKAVAIDCAGFYLHRQDYLFGKKLLHGETEKVRLLRLARKDAGNWTRSVHEVWNVKGVVGTLDHPLDHYPHPDVAQFITDINTYSTLNARYLHEHNVHVPGWQILAYPLGKFFIDYFWYQGFRDGTPGAIMAIGMSMHSFLTRAKLWLLWHTHE